jgi:riboflavin synthase alpha subunit
MTITANSIKGYEVYCSVMPAPNEHCHIARWNGPSGSYCNIESAEFITHLVTGDVLTGKVTGTNPVVITALRKAHRLCRRQTLDRDAALVEQQGRGQPEIQV